MKPGEKSAVKKIPRDELDEPFFSEVDTEGRMVPERLAEHSSSLELLSRWKDLRGQIEKMDSKNGPEEKEIVLRTMHNHEAAMRQAIVLKGGISGVSAELEKGMIKGQDNLQIIKGLEHIFSLVTQDALKRSDVATLNTLSRLFAQASAYLRSVTQTLQVEKLTPLVNKVSQLVNSELRTREQAPGGQAQSYASVEEARAARRAEQGLPPEEDEEVAEAVLEDGQEAEEEASEEGALRKAANGQ